MSYPSRTSAQIKTPSYTSVFSGDNPHLEFFATCPAGFERLLAHELHVLRIKEVRPLKGRVAFFGSIEDGYRACMYARLASRIILVLTRITATDQDTLFDGVYGISWEDHISEGASIAIDAHGTNALLSNTNFIALKTKDAICDRMLAHTGMRPAIDTHMPDLKIDVHISKDKASVGIDFSGEPLFWRGYERAGNTCSLTQHTHTKGSRTPALRSDYAAAFLSHMGWYTSIHQDVPTLVVLDGAHEAVCVEACAIALGIPAGITRVRWGFLGWKQHSETVWKHIIEHATTASTLTSTTLDDEDVKTVPHVTIRIMRPSSTLGAYTYTTSITRLKTMLAAAHISQEKVTIEVCEKPISIHKDTFVLADMSSYAQDTPCEMAEAVQRLHGFIRLCDEPSRKTKARAASDTTCVNISLLCEEGLYTLVNTGAYQAQQDPLITKKGNTTLLFSNLTVATDMLDTLTLAGSFSHNKEICIPILDKGSQQFASRFKKVLKERRAWAAREDVSCMRIYDCDLPDFALSCDLFHEDEGYTQEFSRAQKHTQKEQQKCAQTQNVPQSCAHNLLHISEYAAPKEIERTKAQRRLIDAITLAAIMTNTALSRVFVDVRTQAKGGSQYAGPSSQHARQNTRVSSTTNNTMKNPSKTTSRTLEIERGSYLIDEGGLCFEVNFSKRHDCGIFLDLRDIRSEIRERMKQTKGSKRFLNLFCYTATSTCYAADGGAKYTTSVDLSAPSLAWAQRNMERNGFSGDNHEYVQEDVLAWTQEMRHSKNRWDLILCDVPTFSNSNSMKKSSWDVQRDHAELIITLSRLLTQEGHAIFSCNLKSFKLDIPTLTKAGVDIKDITHESIPHDFARTQNVHHAYIITRTKIPQ